MARPLRLDEHLEGADDLLVVLAPGLTRDQLEAAGCPHDGELLDLVSPMPRPREWDAVLLAVHDLVSLRRAVTGLGNFGTARRIGLWFARETTRLPTVTPHPAWPPLDGLVASRRGGGFVLLDFAAPAPVRPVLVQLALAGSPSGSHSMGWPALGVRRDQPWLWPVADPAATVAIPRRLFDGTVDSPPDLVLSEGLDEVPAAFVDQPHAVLGRTPQVAHVEPDLSWSSVTEMGTETAHAALRRRGPLSLGALDERVVNPIGFERRPVGEPVPLRGSLGDAMLSVPAAPGRPAVAMDDRRGVSEADLPLLRQVPGLALDWRGGHGPQGYCRLVAGLAMAGVPLVTTEMPGWAGHLLSPDLADALSAPVDLADALAREEHSIRLRRAALRSHAAGPWRRALAREHGLQEAPDALVSVLLVTRRPEKVAFALRQVARQRGVHLEVVLATHGFDPDPAELGAFRDSCQVPLTTLTAESTTLFGEVLNQAAQRASGDVLLKMDDDDWYAPDFAGDLLLARGYSGAAIVGCAPEFTFVEPLWVTTRRPGDAEVYRPFVAGGTMLVDRAAFGSVGGFRHTRKYVDANLLSAVLDTGASVYRTHGLGYVLRRGEHGHTWDPGLGYFVSRNRAEEQWRGFRPSALVEADPSDLPSKPADERLTP